MITDQHVAPRIRRVTAAFLGLAAIGVVAFVQWPASPVRVASARVLPSAAATWHADLVVIAPHPDDEALLASGLMLRARQAGEQVAVIVMTNGDFECQADGLVRERESVEGLAALGVEEEHVYFLGYPDGHLARLGKTPLTPVPRRISGVCAPGNHTYGERGHGRSDFHQTRFGTHARYTSEHAVTDLASVLELVRPKRIVVTDPNDTHPDHATTYTLLRRALSRLQHTPQILRGIVHNDDCWPTGNDANGHCTPGQIAPTEAMPPLTGALSGYVPDVRVAVPTACLSPSLEDNPKLRAIGSHHSQTRDDAHSYLFAFARNEEVFYSETFARQGGKSYRVAPDTNTMFVPRLLIRAQVPRPPSSIHGASDEFRASSGKYTLTISSNTPAVALLRNTSEGSQLYKRWPLPHDTFTRHSTELVLKLEYLSPDGTAELGVYASNVLVGVTTIVGARFDDFAYQD